MRKLIALVLLVTGCGSSGTCLLVPAPALISEGECAGCGTDQSSWQTARTRAQTACQKAGCLGTCSLSASAEDQCIFEGPDNGGINGYKCWSTCTKQTNTFDGTASNETAAAQMAMLSCGKKCTACTSPSVANLQCAIDPLSGTVHCVSTCLCQLDFAVSADLAVSPADLAISPDMALPTWTTACAAWNAAIATRTATCLHANPDYLAGLPGAIDCATLQNDIDQGQTSFSPSFAADCTAALEALTCDSLASSAHAPLPFPMSGSACASAVVGMGAVDAPCHRSTQCASDYCTSVTDHNCQNSTCQPRVAAGASCGNPKQCVDGLTCKYSTSTHTYQCTTYTDLNGDCLNNSDCVPGLRCRDLKCQEPLATGGTCIADIDCVAGDGCIRDSENNSTCQPLVGLGGSCTPNPGNPTVCAAGFYCNAGTCAALPAVSGSCLDIWLCIGSYCNVSGNAATCTTYLNNGDTCSSSNQCASQVASGNTCVAPGEFYCVGA